MGVKRATALIVHPDFPGKRDRRDPEARLREVRELVAVISLDIVDAQAISVSRIRPATLIGGGAVQRLKDFIDQNGIDVAVIDAALSPIHQRNLETAWNCKVLDRTALILEIFGARAQTREGRLQVELAALSFQKSRLVRSWTHLERQRGGAGFMGGPGERQIESDRRMIDDQIGRLRRRLDDVIRRRGLQRVRRHRREHPVVALVGYTNAGKSTLFNRLTGADILARDQLFATLDPTMRLLSLPSGMPAVLSDTVGFISDLPTDLIAAFRATLEEVVTADLLIHVRDISHPDTEAQCRDVLDVLAQLGVLSDDGPPILELHNKIDQIPPQAPITREDLRGLSVEAPITRGGTVGGAPPRGKPKTPITRGGTVGGEPPRGKPKTPVTRGGTVGGAPPRGKQRHQLPVGAPQGGYPHGENKGGHPHGGNYASEYPCVAVSALNGAGIKNLRVIVDSMLRRNDTRLTLCVDAGDGALLAWIHRNACVLNRNNGHETVTFDAAFGSPALGRLRRVFAGRFTEKT